MPPFAILVSRIARSGDVLLKEDNTVIRTFFASDTHHVVPGANDGVGLQQGRQVSFRHRAGVVDHLRNAKVAEDDVLLVVEEHVAGLHMGEKKRSGIYSKNFLK